MKPAPCIDLLEFGRLENAICEAGYEGDIQWSETVGPPVNADEFAREAIFVICNSGMRFTVAQGIFDRVMPALKAGKSAGAGFGHPKKVEAIDYIWRNRERLFKAFTADPDKLAYCATLPHIGPITKYHLAKNFGVDVAKPDIHLQRLADREGTTPQALCERLAAETGYRASTVDLILWRACAIGLIDTLSMKRAAQWDRHPEGDETRSGSVERSEIEPGPANGGMRPNPVTHCNPTTPTQGDRP